MIEDLIVTEHVNAGLILSEEL